MPQHATPGPFQDISALPLFKLYAEHLDACARQVAEAQTEILKFMAHGLEEYQKVLQSYSHCRSPAEAAQLQVSFCSRMVTACMAEAGRLTVPFIALALHPHQGANRH